MHTISADMTAVCERIDRMERKLREIEVLLTGRDAQTLVSQHMLVILPD
jgi:hypothetical protein